MTDKEQVIKHLAESYDAITLESVAQWRRVFGTKDGVQVLGELLNMLYFNHNFLASDLEALVHDFARLVAARCGMNHPEHVSENVVIAQLWKMPPLAYNIDEEEQ